MLSRTAQAIYWMSRYVERAENVARFIEVNGHLMLDLPLTPANQWEALLYTTGDQDLFKEHYADVMVQCQMEFSVYCVSYKLATCLRTLDTAWDLPHRA